MNGEHRAANRSRESFPSVIRYPPGEVGVNVAALSDDVRHEVQRGVILMILVHRNLEWVPFNELKVQLARGQNYPLTDSELWFHLRYLASPGRDYVESRNTRPGRVDLSLTQVRATSRAVDLLDGRLEADPGVAF